MNHRVVGDRPSSLVPLARRTIDVEVPWAIEAGGAEAWVTCGRGWRRDPSTMLDLSADGFSDQTTGP